MKKYLMITLKRSPIGKPETQRRIIRGLGLRKLHQIVYRKNCPEIRGMVAKIRHMIQFEEVDAEYLNQ